MLKRKLSWLWMTRLLIVHYLISQGFDTMSIDSDAVVLQNPFKLLDTLNEDVYMCLAMHPFEISNIWGFTGCAGSTIYRSNPRTCEYQVINYIYKISMSSLNNWPKKFTIYCNYSVHPCDIFSFYKLLHTLYIFLSCHSFSLWRIK